MKLKLKKVIFLSTISALTFSIPFSLTSCWDELQITSSNYITGGFSGSFKCINNSAYGSTWSLSGQPNNVSIDNNGLLEWCGFTEYKIYSFTIFTESHGYTASQSVTLDISIYAQFIIDRTFSIGVGCKELIVSNGNKNTPQDHIIAYGTGWIIKDYTTSDVSDYIYYMATNCHVAETIFEKKQYICDDYLQYTDSSNITNYTWMYQGNSGSDFIPSQSSSTPDAAYNAAYTINNNPTNSVDFRILKVDFTNASSTIKQKLDRVNSYCSDNNGWAVKFANSYIGTGAYIGGYPYQYDTSTYSSWEFHSISQYTTTSPFGSSEDTSHAVPDDESSYVDNSPLIYLPEQNSSTSWMNHGASGSMCINNEYELLGIYWGGWTASENSSSSSTLFIPCLDTINNTHYKDFTQIIGGD